MDAELIAVFSALAVSLMAVVCVTLPAMAVPGSMLALPFWYRATWLSYTEGNSVSEAFEAVADGATEGFVQIRPASYLYTDDFEVEAPPDAVLEGLATHYQTFMTDVLLQDDEGVVANVRWPAELGPGWIMVFLVEPGEGGSRVRVRARSTMCMFFPVLTFFLSLQHRLHLRRIVRQAAT